MKLVMVAKLGFLGSQLKLGVPVSPENMSLKVRSSEAVAFQGGQGVCNMPGALGKEGRQS